MENILYKASFVGHPCTQWVMENDKNYYWLTEHAYELCREYTRRYGKVHKTDDMISLIRYRKPVNIPIADSTTPFAQAMPDEYKNTDVVKAYRDYYKADKSYFAKWDKGRATPEWWQNAA